MSSILKPSHYCENCVSETLLGKFYHTTNPICFGIHNICPYCNKPYKKIEDESKIIDTGVGYYYEIDKPNE